MRYGEVSERFKELVLKTSDSAMGRGFESLPLRHVAKDSGELPDLPLCGGSIRLL